MESQEIRARCFSKYAVGERKMGWDPDEVIESEIKFLLEEDLELDREAAWENASGDSDLFQREWDHLTEYLTEVIKKKELDEHPLSCEVSKFGWRGLNGHKVFWADDGSKLLRQVLPDTDNIFDIYEYGENGLAINNRHHDSPVGREWYYITSLLHAECLECGGEFVGDYEPEEDAKEREHIEKHEMCSECLEYLTETGEL